MDWLWWTLIVLVVIGLVLLMVYYLTSNYVDEVTQLINIEFREDAKKHWFLSFRKKKQSLLYSNAERRVARKHPGIYTKYIIGSRSKSLALVLLVFSLYGTIGKTSYEFGWPWLKGILDAPPTQSTEGEYDDEGYDDVPFNEDDNIHHVDPHYVDDYERSDGTEVEGHWRGGEEGYDRSDPDGSLDNNLDNDADSGSIFDIFN